MLDPSIEVESLARRSKGTLLQNIKSISVYRRNNIAEWIHITLNQKMHNIGNIFESGGKLSLGTNEGMGLWAPHSNHVVKKFGLKVNNLLLCHENGVQNLRPCQGRALVRKSKFSIHTICLASNLTEGEFKVDLHSWKQPTLDTASRNAPGINRRTESKEGSSFLKALF